MTQEQEVRPVRRSRIVGQLRNPLYTSGYALLANTAGTTIVGVAYWAIAAHFYSQQVVGRSAALISALILLSTFAQLNLATALPRFIPRAGRSAGKFILSSYGASSCAALIASLVFVTVLPRLSPEWHFVRASVPLAVTFVVAAVVWEVFTLQDIALLSLRRPVLVPVENFVYGVSKLLMLVGIVSVLPLTGIFFSWVVPLAITVPAVNWIIFRRFLKDRDTATSPSTLRAGEVVRFASVDYVGSVLTQAYGNMLPLIVLSTLGAAADSTFYIAWSIASGLGLVASNFGTSLLVEGAAAPDRLADLIRGVLARCVVITSLGAALLILAARPILDIYGAKYAAHATSLLGLLAVGTIPSSLVVVSIALDRIAGRVGRATLTRLVLSVLVLGGAWVLLRRVGVDGVAFSWGGANLLVALARSPTIVAAARRPRSLADMATLTSLPVPDSQHAARTRSQSAGIHRAPSDRRPLSSSDRHSAPGRHRIGTVLVNTGERPRDGSRRHPDQLAQTPPTLSGPELADETARALELLISFGREV